MEVMSDRVHDPSPERPVIIVGAGRTGLSLAAYLLRAGIPTLVLEAAAQAGGASTTQRALGVELPSLELSPRPVSGLVASELELYTHGLRDASGDAGNGDNFDGHIATSWLGGDPLVLFGDAARTLDGLAAGHRYEVENYRRYLDTARPVMALMASWSEPRGDSQGVSRRFRDARQSGLATLTRWRRRSASDVLRSFFESEPLRSAALLRGPVCGGRSPDLPGSGLRALWYAGLHASGTVRPVGGTHQYIQALIAAVETAGGTIRTGASVSRILADHLGVGGVVLADGEEIVSDHVVVACDPRRAVLQWLRPAPASATSLIRRWEAMPVGEGRVARVDAVLGAAPARRADTESALVRLGVPQTGQQHMLVTPGVAGLATGFRMLRQGAVAQRPPLNLIVDAHPQLADRPPTMSFEIYHVPHELAGGWAASREPSRWFDLAADAYGPGLSDVVSSWRVVAPRDFEADGVAPYRSHGYGASIPVAGIAGRRLGNEEHSTPVEGLYLADVYGVGAFATVLHDGRPAAAHILRTLGADLMAVA